MISKPASKTKGEDQGKKNIIGPILFVLGVLFCVSGYYLSDAENYEFVYNMAAPRYANAMAGISKLMDDGDILIKGDRGFDEISRAILTDFNFRNKQGLPVKEDLEGWDITIIVQEIAYLPEANHPDSKDIIVVLLTNDDSYNFIPGWVKDEINAMFLGPAILKKSVILFWTGIVLVLTGYFVRDNIR
ncbi:MAG TPA: hypothetical protein VGB30_11060 [bacterium]|jgi:hypothetical protein